MRSPPSPIRIVKSDRRGPSLEVDRSYAFNDKPNRAMSHGRNKSTCWTLREGSQTLASPPPEANCGEQTLEGFEILSSSKLAASLRREIQKPADLI